MHPSISRLQQVRSAASFIHADEAHEFCAGFCGSLTTFSSWNLDVFLAWENAGGYERVWLYDVRNALG